MFKEKKKEGEIVILGGSLQNVGFHCNVDEN